MFPSDNIFEIIKEKDKTNKEKIDKDVDDDSDR